MLDYGHHTFYVVMAYGLSAFGLCLLSLISWWQYRQQQRQLIMNMPTVNISKPDGIVFDHDAS